MRITSISVAKPERKKLLAKPRRIWENNIKTDLEQNTRVWIGFN
jgi:hypothetical protein